MEAPNNYKTAGTLMLVAGIMNIVSGLVIAALLFLYITGIAIGTFGIGIVCYVCCLWPLIPLAFGVFELMTGLKIMQGQPVAQGSMVSIIGIVVAALNLLSGLSVVPLVLEIVATIMLNSQESKDYIAQGQHDLLT